MTSTSIGGEKQAGISGGVNPPADIASGRIAEMRSRSMSCNCMTRTSQQECRGILEFFRTYYICQRKENEEDEKRRRKHDAAGQTGRGSDLS